MAIDRILITIYKGGRFIYDAVVGKDLVMTHESSVLIIKDKDGDVKFVGELNNIVFANKEPH